MSRKRNSASVTRSQALSQGIDAGTTGEGADPRNPNSEVRPPRIPMDKGRNLEIPGVQLDHDNFYYHWFTEKPNKPGTLARAKAAYYDHVTDREGNVISRPAGDGVTYLMQLPMEYRLQDLAEKRKKVDRTLKDQTQLGENEYAPTKNRPEGGDSSMVEKTTSDNPYAS